MPFRSSSRADGLSWQSAGTRTALAQSQSHRRRPWSRCDNAESEKRRSGPRQPRFRRGAARRTRHREASCSRAARRKRTAVERSTRSPSVKVLRLAIVAAMNRDGGGGTVRTDLCFVRPAY
eukprot:1310844-Prymnesium_polylepis.1